MKNKRNNKEIILRAKTDTKELKRELIELRKLIIRWSQVANAIIKIT